MARRRRTVRASFLRTPRPDKLGVCGLRQNDLHLWTLTPQNSSNPRHGAARPVARYEVIEPLAREVSKDLVVRALVDVGVGFGLKLTRQEPAVGVCQLLCFHIHAEALLGARREHDLGSEEPHELPPFDREAVRHRHNKRVALGVAPSIS